MPAKNLPTSAVQKSGAIARGPELDVYKGQYAFLDKMQEWMGDVENGLNEAHGADVDVSSRNAQAALREGTLSVLETVGHRIHGAQAVVVKMTIEHATSRMRTASAAMRRRLTNQASVFRAPAAFSKAMEEMTEAAHQECVVQSHAVGVQLMARYQEISQKLRDVAEAHRQLPPSDIADAEERLSLAQEELNKDLKRVLDKGLSEMNQHSAGLIDEVVNGFGRQALDSGMIATAATLDEALLPFHSWDGISGNALPSLGAPSGQAMLGVDKQTAQPVEQPGETESLPAPEKAFVEHLSAECMRELKELTSHLWSLEGENKRILFKEISGGYECRIYPLRGTKPIATLTLKKTGEERTLSLSVHRKTGVEELAITGSKTEVADAVLEHIRAAAEAGGYIAPRSNTKPQLNGKGIHL